MLRPTAKILDRPDLHSLYWVGMSQEENDSVVWRKDNGKIGKSGFCSRSYEPDVHSSQFSFLLDLVNKY